MCSSISLSVQIPILTQNQTPWLGYSFLASVYKTNFQGTNTDIQ